jgi:hypothetical protein
MKSKSAESVCERYAGKADNVCIRQLDEQTVLIEGSKESLEFLGALLVAQAHSQTDCGVQISPNGPGSCFFGEGSLGIYVHRVPCGHSREKNEA